MQKNELDSGLPIHKDHAVLSSFKIPGEAFNIHTSLQVENDH